MTGGPRAEPTRPADPRSPLARVLIVPIRWYQRYISRVHPAELPVLPLLQRLRDHRAAHARRGGRHRPDLLAAAALQPLERGRRSTTCRRRVQLAPRRPGTGSGDDGGRREFTGRVGARPTMNGSAPTGRLDRLAGLVRQHNREICRVTFNFWSLDYIYYPVSGIMWVWHKVFGSFLGPDSALTWVLSRRLPDLHAARDPLQAVHEADGLAAEDAGRPAADEEAAGEVQGRQAAVSPKR